MEKALTVDYVVKGYPHYRTLEKLWDLGFDTYDKLHKFLEVIVNNRGDMSKLEVALKVLLHEIENEPTEPAFSYNPYRELIEVIDSEGKCKQ